MNDVPKPSPKPKPPPSVRRSRLFLILICLVFAAPMIVAGLLTVGGWQPTAKGNGEPILPQRNFITQHVQVQLADGSQWPWKDSKPRLTLVALPGPDCAQRCYAALTAVAKARIMLNRNQQRLRLLYVGTPPQDPMMRKAMLDYWRVGHDVNDALAAYRPSAPDSLSAVLVESNGTALSLYPDGFDAAGLRRDLDKVTR